VSSTNVAVNGREAGRAVEDRHVAMESRIRSLWPARDYIGRLLLYVRKDQSLE
jgi:hypothetical protein